MFLLQFKIKSYKQKQLKNYIKNLFFFNNKFKKKITLIKVYEPQYKNKIFVTLKSPHINKKSKEHFRYKVYKKIIFYKIDNILLLFNFIILFIKISKIKNFLLNLKIKQLKN